MLVKNELLVVIVGLVLTVGASGQQKQSPSAMTQHSEGIPCLFDPQLGEVPHCLYKNAQSELFISPAFLRDLSFNRDGLAAVRALPEGWTYANRQGRVVITGVAESDNWADSFHDGLVRVLRNGKYGFANREGKIVIAPDYDGALNFQNGIASVCQGCQNKCADAACEYHSFVGGRWFHLDTKGNKVVVLH